MWVIAVFLTVIALVAKVNSQTASQCSPQHRSQDLQSCLTAIGAMAQDRTQFWFGTKFNQRCPQGPQPLLECYLPPGLEIPQSIASMIFTNGTFNPNTLDRYLDVTYTSPPGQYSGCGNIYTSSESKTFTLDPILPETHDCWTLREFPTIMWDGPSDQLYTLLIYDVGFGFRHGIFVNIQGNFVKQEVIKEYSGPLNPRRGGNVYAFLLFTQSQAMTVDTRFKNVFPGQTFNVSEFVGVQGLAGPVAMNWVLATGDPYSVETQKRYGVVDNCASFVTDALAGENRPFLSNVQQLEVRLDVTYDSKAFSFSSCCGNTVAAAQTVKTNPLGDGPIKAAVARHQPDVQLTLPMIGFNPATAFSGKMYTLAMVDPDALSRAATNERPLLHWLIINIPDGFVKNGSEVVTYIGPSPPDNLPHVYYFMLYEQQRSVSETAYRQYASNTCTGLLANRCHFDVSGFATGSGLRLVGVSWFVSNQDEFVRYQRIQRGASEEEVCSGLPGYVNGTCVSVGSGSSRTVQLHSQLIGYLVILLIIML